MGTMSGNESQESREKTANSDAPVAELALEGDIASLLDCIAVNANEQAAAWQAKRERAEREEGRAKVNRIHWEQVQNAVEYLRGRLQMKQPPHIDILDRDPEVIA